jgi:capsular polysaccharide biosynthesis protein
MPISFRPTTKPLWAFIAISGFVFLFVLGTVALVTFIYPETFASAARVEVPATHASSPGSEALVVSSTVVLEKTVQALNLQAVWGKKYNNGRLLWASDCIAMLKSRLEVSTVTPDGHWLEIRAFSDNPEEAARLANGVADSYYAYREEQDHKAREAIEESPFMISDPMVRVTDHAIPNYQPVRPNKALNLSVGAFIGILAGAIVASITLGIFASLRRSWNVYGLPQKA